MSKERFLVHQNTPQEAERVGWVKVPEHCIGDQARPYVLHDFITGKFFFLQEVDCPRCPVKMTMSGHLCEDCGLNV